jgi:hypothetical protein
MDRIGYGVLRSGEAIGIGRLAKLGDGFELFLAKRKKIALKF